MIIQCLQDYEFMTKLCKLNTLLHYSSNSGLRPIDNYLRNLQNLRKNLKSNFACVCVQERQQRDLTMKLAPSLAWNSTIRSINAKTSSHKVLWSTSNFRKAHQLIVHQMPLTFKYCNICSTKEPTQSCFSRTYIRRG